MDATGIIWRNGSEQTLQLVLLAIKSLLSHSIYKSGDYYIGEFKDGYIHGQGQGTCWWANGSKYVGEWKNSCRHGKGTEYAADGQISKEGVWENNVYVGKG